MPGVKPGDDGDCTATAALHDAPGLLSPAGEFPYTPLHFFLHFPPDSDMNSMDQQVVGRLSEWLRAGKQCWLCTIIQTFGSSPRPVGSLLACNEDGEYAGSLSGGCVEDDLRESILRGDLA